jgi:DNA-binding NarL/FixJ family response regulator
MEWRLDPLGTRLGRPFRRLRIVGSDPASEPTRHDRALRAVVGAKQYLVQQGIRAVLANYLSLDVVGTAPNGDALRALVEQEEADLVVCELAMPPSGSDEGLEVARWLRRVRPDAGAVLIGEVQDARQALRLMEGGSARRGYVLADDITSEADLAAVVLEVATGGSVIDATVFEHLDSMEGQTALSPLAALSTRERQVLEGIAEGKANAAIARSLQLSKRAVEKHISSIFETLDLPGEEEVSRRVMATLLFLTERE